VNSTMDAPIDGTSTAAMVATPAAAADSVANRR
jgi:hypothetical protein